MHRPVAFVGCALTLTLRAAALVAAGEEGGCGTSRINGGGTVAAVAAIAAETIGESIGAGVGCAFASNGAGGVGALNRAGTFDGRTVDGGGVCTGASSTAESRCGAGGGTGRPCARAGDAANAKVITESAVTPMERETMCIME